MTHLDIIRFLAAAGYTYDVLGGGRFRKDGTVITIRQDAEGEHCTETRVAFENRALNARGSFLVDGMDQRDGLTRCLAAIDRINTVAATKVA